MSAIEDFLDRLGDLSKEQQKDLAYCMLLIERGYRLYSLSSKETGFYVLSKESGKDEVPL